MNNEIAKALAQINAKLDTLIAALKLSPEELDALSAKLEKSTSNVAAATAAANKAEKES
jgi:hypothetical protein